LQGINYWVVLFAECLAKICQSNDYMVFAQESSSMPIGNAKPEAKDEQSALVTAVVQANLSAILQYSLASLNIPNEADPFSEWQAYAQTLDSNLTEYQRLVLLQYKYHTLYQQWLTYPELIAKLLSIKEFPSKQQESTLAYETTAGDGNCFFHAAFARYKNNQEAWQALEALVMRQEWARFLHCFTSLADQQMPPLVNTCVRNALEKLFAFPETGGSSFANNPTINDLRKDVQHRLIQAQQQYRQLVATLMQKLQTGDEMVKAVFYQLLRDCVTRSEVDKVHYQRIQTTLCTELAAIIPLTADTLWQVRDRLLSLMSEQYLLDRLQAELQHYACLFDPSTYPNAELYDQQLNATVIVEQFLKSPAVYQAYRQAIQSPDYYVTSEEMPLLASLSGTTLHLYYRERNGQMRQQVFTPDPSLLASVPHYQSSLMIPWNGLQQAYLYHEGFLAEGKLAGLHYSRGKAEYLQASLISSQLDSSMNLTVNTDNIFTNERNILASLQRDLSTTAGRIIDILVKNIVEKAISTIIAKLTEFTHDCEDKTTSQESLDEALQQIQSLLANFEAQVKKAPINDASSLRKARDIFQQLTLQVEALNKKRSTSPATAVQSLNNENSHADSLPASLATYWQENRLRLEQQLLLEGPLAHAFASTLTHIAEAGLHLQVPKGIFICYAWPDEKEVQEQHLAWVQPFLVGLRQHLIAAGIATTKLDIKDNLPGNNIYEYMQGAETADFVLLIGTETLLKKHQKGTSAVCTELIKINHKREHDRQRGRYRVIPLLISGDYQASFPAHYELYTTVKQWVGKKTYFQHLQWLLAILYLQDINNEHVFEAIWNSFLEGLDEEARIIVELGLDEASVVQKLQQEAQTQVQLRQKQQQASAKWLGLLEEIEVKDKEKAKIQPNLPELLPSYPKTPINSNMAALASALAQQYQRLAYIRLPVFKKP